MSNAESNFESCKATVCEQCKYRQKSNFYADDFPPTHIQYDPNGIPVCKAEGMKRKSDNALATGQEDIKIDYTLAATLSHPKCADVKKDGPCAFFAALPVSHAAQKSVHALLNMIIQH